MSDGEAPARAGVLPGWARMNQAERDAAYNNTAAVADVASLHAARAAASLRTRAAPGSVLDVRYGPAPRNLIDLFPAPNPTAPCLVFIHGGYWQMNSKDSFACLGDGVRAHGWAAAFPGYTLAPDISVSGILAEIGTMLDFLAREGPRHGIAGRLIVGGWSAGGQLAAMALGHSAVAAGLSLSGIHELGPLRDTYLNERLSLTDAEIATLSPLRLPVVQKPLAVAYGAAELPALVLNARAFWERRAAAGAPGELMALQARNHFSVLEELRTADGALTRALLRLLDQESW